MRQAIVDVIVNVLQPILRRIHQSHGAKNERHDGDDEANNQKRKRLMCLGSPQGIDSDHYHDQPRTNGRHGVVWVRWLGRSVQENLPTRAPSPARQRQHSSCRSDLFRIVHTEYSGRERNARPSGSSANDKSVAARLPPSHSRWKVVRTGCCRRLTIKRPSGQCRD